MTEVTMVSRLSSLPYKKGDLVKCYYPNRQLPPRELKIEEIEISSWASGVRLQLEGVRTPTGCTLWLDSFWVEAIKEEPKAMDIPTNHEVRWIPVDAENLPEGEVLAIDSEGLTMVGYSELRHYGKHGVVIVDDDGYEIEDVHSFIPMKHLIRLWREQNQVVPDFYSKDSEAYEILLWNTKDSDSLLKEPFHSALVECPPKATKLLQLIAVAMVKETYLEKESERIIANTRIMDELVFWLKEYISNK
jgi:hypothetical protein